MEGQQAAKGDQQIRYEQDCSDIAGHGEGFKPGAIAAENGGQPDDDGDVPKNDADENNPGAWQRRATETAEQPQSHPQRRRHGETVEQGGLVRNVDATVSQI